MVFKLIESPIEEGVIEIVAIKMNNNIIANVNRPPSGNKEHFKDLLAEWITANISTYTLQVTSF